MSLGAIVAIVVLLVTVGLGLRTKHTSPDAERGPAVLSQVKPTAKRLYSRRNFIKAACATGGAAVLAYSGADEAIDRWHSGSVRSETTEGAAHVAKEFGENIWVGVWVGMALIDYALPSTGLSRWGRRCFESTLVGLPALWAWQRALGASRPSDEKDWGGRFLPFTDENSVSGHTFLGAVPWLVAARSFGAPAPRTIALALSPWTGWSRIHDRRHYLSQALLGYGLAWEAVRATDPELAETEAVTADA